MSQLSTAVPWTSLTFLTFDVFGTLVDEESGMYEALKASSLGPHLPGTRFEIVTKFKSLESEIQRETPTKKQSAVQAEGVRRLAKHLDLVPSKLSDEELEKAAISVGQSIGTWRAFPDTVAAMQSLSKHYKLAPLTNMDWESFDAVCAGPLKGVPWNAKYLAEDIGSYKPDHKNFIYLLKHLKNDFGVEKAQLGHVANSLNHDHIPGKELGLCTVWIDRTGRMEREGFSGQEGKEKYGYRLRFETLGELAQFVDKAWEESRER